MYGYAILAILLRLLEVSIVESEAGEVKARWFYCAQKHSGHLYEAIDALQS